MVGGVVGFWRRSCADATTQQGRGSMTHHAEGLEGIRPCGEWLSLLKTEFASSYMADLKLFLTVEKREGKAIYPPGREFFAALDATPPSQVRVVLIGQDPYHGAHTVCRAWFSWVPSGKGLGSLYRQGHISNQQWRSARRVFALGETGSGKRGGDRPTKTLRAVCTSSVAAVGT